MNGVCSITPADREIRATVAVRSQTTCGLSLSDDWVGGRPESPTRDADPVRYGRLGRYLGIAATIPGWTRGDEAVEVARVACGLPKGAVVVELGAFLGCSTVLLAGARRVAGSGCVFSIDPFDASGDPFSAPVYHTILAQLPGTLRGAYEENIARAGLTDFVVTQVGRAEEVVNHWTLPIDMLFMDGDHTRESARAVYDAWSPFLKIGGVLAVHSTTSTEEHHDGFHILAREMVIAPRWSQKRLVRTTTFARKAS